MPKSAYDDLLKQIQSFDPGSDPVPAPVQRPRGMADYRPIGGSQNVQPPPPPPISPGNAGMGNAPSLSQALAASAPQPEDDGRTVMGTLGDIGVTLGHGLTDTAEAVTGLANIGTMGQLSPALNKLGEMTGITPESVHEKLDTWYSDPQQAANERVSAAMQEAEARGDGFFEQFKAAGLESLENPSTIGHGAVRTLLPMAFGGLLTRGAMVGAGLSTKAMQLAQKSPILAKIARLAAIGGGEGAVASGMGAEQIRQETGDLTPKQIGTTVLSGGITAAITAASAGLAQKLGFVDPETLFAGLAKETGVKLTPATFLKTMAGSGISEGVFEEMPQSAQEQMLMNHAMGKPLMEGVAGGMAQGGLIGATMGMGVNAAQLAKGSVLNDRFDTKKKDNDELDADLSQDPLGKEVVDTLDEQYEGLTEEDLNAPADVKMAIELGRLATETKIASPEDQKARTDAVLNFYNHPDATPEAKQRLVDSGAFEYLGIEIPGAELSPGTEDSQGTAGQQAPEPITQPYETTVETPTLEEIETERQWYKDKQKAEDDTKDSWHRKQGRSEEEIDAIKAKREADREGYYEGFEVPPGTDQMFRERFPGQENTPESDTRSANEIFEEALQQESDRIFGVNDKFNYHKFNEVQAKQFEESIKWDRVQARMDKAEQDNEEVIKDQEVPGEVKHQAAVEASRLIAEDPVYAQIDEAKKRGRINLEAFQEDYDNVTTRQLQMRYPGLFSRVGNLKPDEFANEMGYEGSDQMIEAWKNAKTKKQLQAELTSQFHDQWKDTEAEAIAALEAETADFDPNAPDPWDQATGSIEKDTPTEGQRETAASIHKRLKEKGAKVFPDNPGGDWLQHQRDQVEKDGYRGPETLGVRDISLPVDTLVNLKGTKNEQDNINTEKVDKYSKSMQEGGFDPDGAIHIVVDYQGNPTIAEGNHRIRAAQKAGITEIPLSISYHAGGEDVAGILSPDKLADLATKTKPEPREQGTAKAEQKTKEVSPGDTIYFDDAEGKKRIPANFRGWNGEDAVVVMDGGMQMSIERDRIHQTDTEAGVKATAFRKKLDDTLYKMTGKIADAPATSSTHFGQMFKKLPIDEARALLDEADTHGEFHPDNSKMWRKEIEKRAQKEKSLNLTKQQQKEYDKGVDWATKKLKDPEFDGYKRYVGFTKQNNPQALAQIAQKKLDDLKTAGATMPGWQIKKQFGFWNGVKQIAESAYSSQMSDADAAAKPTEKQAYALKKDGEFVHVQKAPTGNWTWYTTDDLTKKQGSKAGRWGTSGGKDGKGQYYFDTEAEAQTALDEYAKEKGLQVAQPQEKKPKTDSFKDKQPKNEEGKIIVGTDWPEGGKQGWAGPVGGFKTERGVKGAITRFHKEHVLAPGMSIGYEQRDGGYFISLSKGSTLEAAPKESIVAGQEIEADPSDPQKEAGNYQKGHKNFDGMEITIENPVGSTRSGTDPQGKAWSIEMKNDYGYIKGSKGFDKDHIDIFIAPDYKGKATHAYIINQVNKDGSFDEHKTVIGVANEAEALALYNQNYEAGWDGGKSVTKVALSVFKNWTQGAGPAKGEYKRVKTKLARDLKPTGQDNNYTAFRSGAGNPNDFKGQFEAGVPSGVEVFSLGKRTKDLIIKAANAGIPSFVDNGAFPIYQDGKKNKTATHMSFEEAAKAIETFTELAEATKDADAKLTMVAPDAVGDQALTLEFMERNKLGLKKLLDLGVDLIFPVQRGEKSPIEVINEYQKLMGEKNLRIGIPSNEQALPIEQVKVILNSGLIEKVHYLGMSPQTRSKAGKEKLKLMNDHPNIDFSMDANRMMAKIGRDKPGGRDITAYRDKPPPKGRKEAETKLQKDDKGFFELESFVLQSFDTIREDPVAKKDKLLMDLLDSMDEEYTQEAYDAARDIILDKYQPFLNRLRTQAVRQNADDFDGEIRYSYADLSKKDKKIVDNFIDTHEDTARIRVDYDRLQGTNWEDLATEGILVRQAIEDMIAGKEPSVKSALDSPRAEKIRRYIQQEGADGAWRYLAEKTFIGRPSKPGLGISSSFINCSPSNECAEFCYAAKPGANYRHPSPMVKSELITWAIEQNPKRAAKMAARQYKSLPEFEAKKALRLFDKGDMTQEWVTFINELNRHGVRGAVFSKRPELLRQINKKNLAMLSVDKSNFEMADQNPDLKLAVVYSGKADLQFLRDHVSQVRVILPVRIGKEKLDPKDYADIPQELNKKVCPAEKGLTFLGGKWKCTACDKDAGAGCYHGSVTAGISMVETPLTDQDISGRVAELHKFFEELPDGQRKQFRSELDLLVSEIQSGVDPGSVNVNEAEIEEGTAEPEKSRDKTPTRESQSTAEVDIKGKSLKELGATVDRANLEMARKFGQRLRGKPNVTPFLLPADIIRRNKDGRVSHRGAPKNNFELAERIAEKLFNKKIIWASLGDNFHLNGAVATKGEMSEYVFLDVRTPNPVHGILGHELSHFMQAERPDVFQDLYDAIKPMIENSMEYRVKRNHQGKSLREVNEEIIGDIMGDAFTDPNFWDQVAQQSPSKIRRILATVRQWINSLIGRVHNLKGFGSEQFVKDFEAAQKAVVDATARYAFQNTDNSPKVKPWTTPQQSHTSAKTSIRYKDPQKNAPIIFNAVRNGKINVGPVNADIGGGTYNDITNWLKGRGVENIVIDRFNRDAKHNKAAISKVKGGQADTATVSNVLNVIPDKKNREVVIASATDAVRPGGKVFFTMYDATTKKNKGSGESKQDQWQNRRKTNTYIPEIEKYLSNVRTVPGTQVVEGTVPFTDISESGIAAPWHSRLAKVFNNGPKAATATEWKKQIDKWKKSGTISAPLLEEMEWAGIDELLDSYPTLPTGDKVTKKQLLDRIFKGVHIQEVEKGGFNETSDKAWDEMEQAYVDNNPAGLEPTYDEDEGGWLIYDENGEPEYNIGGDLIVYGSEANAKRRIDVKLREEVARMTPQEAALATGIDIEGELPGGPAMHNSIDLNIPGGKRYRELLLTMPPAEDIPIGERVEKLGFEVVEHPNGQIEVLDKNGKRHVYGDAWDVIGWLENNEVYTGEYGNTYNHDHWDEPNVLAHIRFDERTDTDNNKVLFIQEIQSDWHQEGRREGYRGDFSKLEKQIMDHVRENKGDVDDTQWAINELKRDPLISRNPNAEQAWEVIGIQADALIINEKLDINEFHDLRNRGVPNAPFKKSWPMLAMKRMIRYAAEYGYDRVAWTTGNQQANRYDLSKQVDRIVVDKHPKKQTYRVLAYRGDLAVVDRFSQEDKLADLIGKELAEKAIKDKGGEYSGLDLRVGGAGMQAFYDKMLPNQTGKFIKKFGAKVAPITIPIDSSEQWLSGSDIMADLGIPEAEHSEWWKKAHAEDRTEQLFADYRTKHFGGQKQLGFEITEKMRSSALQEGMPRFSENRKKLQKVDTGSDTFKKWFGNSKVVDDYSGEPLVVYHGTTHDFSEFSNANENIENDFGGGYYFSNEPEDVSANYAGEGPDLTGRIELLAERIENGDPPDVPGLDIDELEAAEGNSVAAKQLAREVLSGGSPNMIPAYLSFQNPAVFGGQNETFFEYTLERDPDEIADFKDQAWDEMKQDDEDLTDRDREDNQDEIDWRADELYDENRYEPEEVGTLVDLIDSIERVARSQFGANDEIQEFINDLKMKGMDYGGMSASDVQQLMKNDQNMIEIMDDEGKQASSEMFRLALQWAGYDGIIDHTVDVKFGSQRRIGQPMEGMNYDTVHYIAFEPHQVKSAITNTGDFSTHPDIRYSEAPNQAFNRWFGSSEVVDDTGNPLEVHHGSATFGKKGEYTFKDIGSPNTNSPLAGLGFFFAENRSEAKGYAGLGGNVETTYLSVKNPLRMNSWELPTFNDRAEAKAFRKRKELQGHDGIYLTDEEHWIAFKPNQAKSADKNIGTYSKDNDDIRYSEAVKDTQKMSGTENLNAEKDGMVSESSRNYGEQIVREMIQKLRDVSSPAVAKARFSDKHLAQSLEGFRKASIIIRNPLKSVAEKQKFAAGFVQKLPAAPRAKLLRSLSQISRVKSEEIQHKRMNRFLDYSNKVMTDHFRKEIMTEIGKAVKPYKRIKGKMEKGRGATFERDLKYIRETALKLDSDAAVAKEVAGLIAERDALQEKFDSVDAKEQTQIRERVNDIESQVIFADLYGNIKEQTFEQILNAKKELNYFLFDGRARWRGQMDRMKTRNEGNRYLVNSEITGQDEPEPETAEQKSKREVEEKTVKGKAKEALSATSNLIQSWELLMDKITKKSGLGTLKSKTVTHFGSLVHRATRAYEEMQMNTHDAVMKKAADIFGTKNSYQLSKAFAKLNKPTTGDVVLYETKTEEIDGETIETIVENPMTMTPLQAAYWYQVSKAKGNPVMQATMDKMGVTDKTLKQIEEMMGPKLKAWADYLVDEFYQDFHTDTNTVYRQMFGVDLEKTPDYVPWHREVAGKKMDMELDSFLSGNMNGSIKKGSLIPRVKNTNRFRMMNINDVLVSHITDMNHFKAWALPTKEINATFNDPVVKNFIRQNYGADTLKTIGRFQDKFVRTEGEMREDMQFLDRIRGNVTRALIGANPVVFLKQLASIPAYMSDIPMADWSKYTAEALTHPNRVYKVLSQSTMWKARYRKGHERDVATAMRRGGSDIVAQHKRLADHVMVLTALGDGTAIMMGGYAVYKSNYNKFKKAGKSNEEANKLAIEQFEMATERAQQSGNLKDLGWFQSGTPMMKLFTMFMTAPASYSRQIFTGVRNMKTDPKDSAKRLFVFGVMMPVIFQAIADALMGADGDDEDKERFYKNQAKALALAPTNGLPVIRTLMEGYANQAFGNGWYKSQYSPVMEIFDTSKETVNDFTKSLQGGTDYVTGEEYMIQALIGLVDTAGFATGVPTKPVRKIGKGLLDATGTDIPGREAEDTEHPYRRSLGYSPYVVGES